MTRYRTLGLFVLLAAVWGSAFMAINAGLEYVPPVLFAAVRYDIAGLVMLAYAAYATDAPVPRSRADWADVAVGALLIIAAYHALLFIGQTDPGVTSAAAAVVVSLSPILTTGFARVFLPGERLTPVGIVGLALGLVGVAVLSELEPGNLLASDAVPTLLILGAAAAFALGSVLSRRVDSDLPIETLEAWAMLLGAVLMHVVSVGLGESTTAVTVSLESVAALAYLSIAASALGFLVYFELLDRLGPIEINLVSYVAPVFAALSGWAFLNEIPTAGTAGGFGLIFAGFLLVKRRAVAGEIHRLTGRGAPDRE
ncbi:EamA family transporter (plasmid) [Halobaculum sp. CBA1158]|uniref:DMT family transporter n=1 Tax=Halobaculum sp. CBA1158 TaxID=2904243 RepID=UPI001F399DC6|nr:EamA family transporter [Halobaculum sp. CBA1158]UIP01382.1 EamA family transporter [Halobaculum sp. CBA1158]